MTQWLWCLAVSLIKHSYGTFTCYRHLSSIRRVWWNLVIKNVFPVYIITQHWNFQGCSDWLSRGTRKYSFHMVNIMATDGLLMPGHKQAWHWHISAECSEPYTELAHTFYSKYKIKLISSSGWHMGYHMRAQHQGPLLLIWFNFNPSMDK